VSAAQREVSHVYFGTSEFAATVLTALAGSAHPPGLVVTPPDRRQGRGRRKGPPPAAEAARRLGIELHQTESVNCEESRRAILDRGPELATVCAFGQLIKEPLLTELPMLNVHPSLLPRWRGAAPIERAIMAGDEVSGVCVIRLTAELDSGPVATREELAIEAGEDYGSLAARLAALGGRLLVEALDRHAAGTIEFTEQVEAGVTYAEKLEPGERRVDPSRPAEEEANRVRALSPHIGAFAEVGGQRDRLGLREVDVRDDSIDAGSFLVGDAGELLLGCSPGSIAIGMVQPAGGRWMAAGDYLRGHGLPAGTHGA
jgi:methionyl-tRNA formyltransferase